MKATATFAVTAGLIAVMLSAGARAASPVALTVRLYNAARIPDAAMVAEWPDALLARKGDAWRFSAFEAAAMRHVLASIAG